MDSMKGLGFAFFSAFVPLGVGYIVINFKIYRNGLYSAVG